MNKTQIKTKEVVGIQTPIDIYFLEKLQNLEQKRYVDDEKYKKYYTDLSEIFRGYLEHRFDVPALESATHDLKILLKDIQIQEKWLIDFLRNCDLVKFAKGEPVKEASVLFLDNIREFIKHHKTKPVEQVSADLNIKGGSVN